MKPGVYTDLSNDAYHAETDWVSSSMLKQHLPEWFKPFNGSGAADFGTAVHSRLLGGPSEPVVVGEYDNWMSKASKEFKTETLAAGGIPILAKEAALLDAIYDAVGSHSEASKLVFGGEGQPEVSVFAEVDSVPSKARFDRIVGTTAVDVKTTSSQPGVSNLAKAVLNFGYDCSQEHYLAVAEAAGIELDSFVFVFVGSAPPHHVTVVELDEGFRERGATLRDMALQRFLHEGMVEAYPGEIGRLQLSLPRWAEL